MKIRQFIRNSEDCKLFISALTLYALAVALVINDTVALVRHVTITSTGHIPFFLAAAFIAAGTMALYVARSGYSVRRPDGTYDTSSCLHPDHHPRGRIDAPDGTSD
jgi:hypothetical protein